MNIGQFVRVTHAKKGIVPTKFQAPQCNTHALLLSNVMEWNTRWLSSS